VGEWSLATDNCAMWLNGLNNNVPGYPKVVCDMVKCPLPYMAEKNVYEQPGQFLMSIFVWMYYVYSINNLHLSTILEFSIIE
jgi:hypothetical protein